MDLEQAELEQQRASLKLKYAILEAHYDRLDHLEHALSSEYELMGTIGKRRF